MAAAADKSPLSEQEAALYRMRHSCAHLLAAAVQSLWPEAKFGVGPAVKFGFYYDILLPTPLGPPELQKIEKRMRELRNKKHPFIRQELPIDEAIAEMARRGQQFKVELLTLLKEKGSTAVAKETGDDDLVAEGAGAGQTTVSFYQTGDFVDLCRGPHVETTNQIGAFKLTTVAGAYWRGDEKNPQLQRVYGLCFATQEELDRHLAMLEEAKRRDHRRLGQELDLFAFSDLVGPGLPLFTPKGTLIRRLLEDFVQGLQEPLGSATDIGLPPSHPTLPSMLRKAGYRTALVGKWHMGDGPGFGPLLSGYDHFYGFLPGASDYFRHAPGNLVGGPRSGLFDGEQPSQDIDLVGAHPLG